MMDNCSGVDTSASKSQVITLATFTKFLESRQQEKLTMEQIQELIKVRKTRSRLLILNIIQSRRHDITT